MLPSRNGVSVAKALVPCGRPRSFPAGAAQHRQLPEFGFDIDDRDHRCLHWQPLVEIIPPHFDFSDRQFRRPAIRIRIMLTTNASAPMNWDDVRVFLAVARNGSLRAAGRALGLSQPTIGRRLSGFEASFGGPTLFDRLPEACASMPPANRWSRRRAARTRRSGAGAPTRCGVARAERHGARLGWRMGSRFPGAPSVGRLRAALAPGITLELVESPEMANLARRDADLAVRHGHAIPTTAIFTSPSSGRSAVPSINARDQYPDAGRGHRWIAYPRAGALVSALWLDQQIRAGVARSRYEPPI